MEHIIEKQDRTTKNTLKRIYIIRLSGLTADKKLTNFTDQLSQFFCTINWIHFASKQDDMIENFVPGPFNFPVKEYILCKTWDMS